MTVGIIVQTRTGSTRLPGKVMMKADDKLLMVDYVINQLKHSTLHDEIVIEAPKEQVQKATEWLKRCMEEGMGEFLHEVPVAVDISVKDSWG